MLRRARRRPSSTATVLTGLAVMATALAVTPPSAADDPQGEDGRMVIVLEAPEGVPAQALLAGTSAQTLLKTADAQRETVAFETPSGSHTLRALPTTSGGRTWQVSKEVTTVEVNGDETTRVVLTWRKVVPPVEVQVTRTTERSISLEWRSDRAKARYVVRRAVGETPPASRMGGSPVHLDGADSVEDTGLSPDTQYSYSVFAQGPGGWSEPTTVTTATRPKRETDPTAASYALLPHAFVVEPGDADVVSVVSGQVWVTLAGSRPAPVLGAGVALPISEALPGGFLGRIVEVSVDGRSVRLEQAGLPEVFSHYNLATEFHESAEYEPVVVDNTARVAAPGPSPRSATSGRLTTRAAAEAPASSTGQSCLDYSVAQLKLEVRPALTATGGYSTQVHSSWGIPKAVTVDLDAAMTARAGMDLDVGKELSCFQGLKDFPVVLSTTPVPTMMLWELGATVSSTGAIKLEGFGASATTTFGASARLGDGANYSPRHSDVTGELFEPAGGGSAKVAIGLGGKLTVGPGAAAKDAAGAIAGIGGTFDLLKASAEGAFGEDEADSCLTLTAETVASLRFHAKAFAGPLSAESEWELWEGSHPWGTRSWPTGCDATDPTLGTGDVQVTLSWANGDDLDLHVVDPSGEEIAYYNPTSASGGQLDVDQIPDCGATPTESVENVFWPTNESPEGRYQVWVDEYNDCDPTESVWTLTIRIDGRVHLRRTGSGSGEVYSFLQGEL